VFLIVSGQHGIGGGGIGDIGIKRRRLHGRSRNRLSSINFALAPLAYSIDDRESVAPLKHMECPLYPGGLNRSTQHFILKERWSVV
jgi:hypothetical protein